MFVGYTGPLSPTSLAAGRPALPATGWMIASLASFPPMPAAAPPAAGRPALRATRWMIASIASFVLMTVAARQLTGHMGTFEILFLRSLVALAILLALRPARPPPAPG